MIKTRPPMSPAAAFFAVVGIVFGFIALVAIL